MREGAEQSACPFCLLNDPDVTVFADALVQALVSRAPINRYHVIIVPRAHLERFAEVPAATMAAVVSVAQRIGSAIALAATPDGITYITDDDLTGRGYNLVAHWKLHVIARFRDEAVRIDWARTEDPGPTVRASLAADIRRHLPPPL
ncbi:MAG: HIT family protein [Anaerolineae bacterium]|nr:HIT family protein [Gemmatimonadaceae bacterium]